MLDNDDTLHEDALLEVARALFHDPDIDVIYTDEDKIDESGQRIDTYHKPDWSPEHLESVMYVLHMLVVRKRLFLKLGGFRDAYSGAQDYDLMLRLSRTTQKIHHIPRALYHWRAVEGSAASVVDAKPYALQAGFRALQDHVRQKHADRAWVEDGLLPGTFRVRRRILGAPRVSLLILTNNGALDLPGRGRFHMVDNLVDSILRRTAYRNFEIVVVDNGRITGAQAERFRSLGVRLEDFTGPVVPFNYAAKANYALRVCRTEHLVILNDDMEVIDEDWLGALLELSQDPEIGAVGGRLLHADGTIQHVGCVIGVNKGTAHVYHSFPGDFVGYNGFTHLIRNYSAVTGACFATRKSVMAQVGGFDEGFAVDFNDIDLCLRIIESGYRIVYTPYCSLFHFEGASAKRVTQNSAERRRFVARWARYMENDPHFNPNFAKDRFDFTVGE
jgi:GT2 family glycosyltransferase